MADVEARAEDAQPAPEKKRGALLIPMIVLVVGCVSAALGFCVPLFFDLKGHQTQEIKVESIPAFISFVEVVVNLDEGRLNRYLRIALTLQVDKSEVEQIAAHVEERKALLKSWLISYLADKSMEDIRGAGGQNRIRRDVLDHFNEVLFDDGSQGIQDVLFEEFSVQ